MANPKDEASRQAFIDKNPFQGLKITDSSFLGTVEGRHPCPQCCKSRKYFCYTCYVPIPELQGVLPAVKLPVKIDIIKHKLEIDGKSTAGHAAVLAPLDINIYTYPDIPDYSGENAVLIFPSQGALNIDQVVTAESYQEILDLYNNHGEVISQEMKGLTPGILMKSAASKSNENEPSSSTKISAKETQFPITKAIFIDSTWNQSRGIYKDERVRKIPCVVIQNRISQFWRHQKGSPRWYLATVEAIHQFLVELHLYRWGLHREYSGIYNCFTENCLVQFQTLLRDDCEAYNGQYDDLLFFFKHMYDLIHTYYKHEKLYAYKRRLK